MTSRPAVTPALIRTAVVRRSHGVQGGARVEVLGDDPHRFTAGLRLTVEDTGEELTVRSTRVIAPHEVLLCFRGHATPEAVEKLRGQYLCVYPESVRTLPESEWFVWQLVGCTAADTAGTRIGLVSDVEPGSVHDTLVVDTGAGERRFPMVGAFISGVDIERREVTLTPWEEDA
ncbi:MAG: ribosome maturation factor RimM [Candidatus Dormibacteria bacterium]